ncbi:cellulose biosynthesis protein BcsN [Rhizobium sp. RU36D]|uniref:cellulose biosynthesis protein BcsN n=1 Tax=Rhizobium sp. RU36D TaxID=1907415 RepID=UPI0009D82C8C|nr:cellulose biosynthesis protein BcsN [Rhizobium sp. RU36D]SMC46426.1 Cellulose biosynthesis protein BcsN [Rhizobium sp. RU36D]
MRSCILTLLALAALAPVTGCTSVQDPFLTGSTSPMTAAALSGSREVGAHLALASVPGAGTVLAVRQTIDPDATRQTIVFANPLAVAGEDVLTIEVASGNSRRFRQAPSRGELQSEMNKALPGIAMTISNTMNDNAYGVFGYASGNTAGGQCVYAWQVIDGGSSSPIGSSHGASIRLRLCRAGVSAENLAALMRGLSVKPLDAATLAALRFAAPTEPRSVRAGVDEELNDVTPERRDDVEQNIVTRPLAVNAASTATISMPDGNVSSAKAPAASSPRVSVPMPAS